MLDAAFGETFDPETTTAFEGGSFEDSSIDNTGENVASGDFNGDGYDDLLILSGGDDGKGTLIFGSADRTDMGDMTEADLGSSNSVTFTGNSQFQLKNMTFLGDINSDGYEDIAFINPGNAAGEGLRVVLGSASPSATIDIIDTSQSNVFSIQGGLGDDLFGTSAAAGGDVNNDGYGDILVSTTTTDTYEVGRGYVIFGHNGAFADMDLTSDPLDGTDGFAIQGHLVGATGDSLGADMSAAEDFNGDGIDDFAISTTVRSGGEGAAFVIYGRDTGFAASMNINDLDSTIGVSIYSDTVDDFGSRLAAAGDFNGDGFDDLAVSNFTKNSDKYAENDGVHIIYGSDSHPAEIQTSEIDGTNGTYLRNANGGQEFGIAISAGADLDGDGFDDLVIGGSEAQTDASTRGDVFVIYGNNRGQAELQTGNMNSAEGTKTEYLGAPAGVHALGASVTVGNFDGDIYNDMAFGNPLWDSDAGKVYYFYGIEGNTAPTVTSIANQTIMEDTSTGDMVFTINDVDGDALSVDVVSNNTGLSPNGNIIINGTGDNRTIRVTPAAAQLRRVSIW